MANNNASEVPSKKTSPPAVEFSNEALFNTPEFFAVFDEDLNILFLNKPMPNVVGKSVLDFLPAELKNPCVAIAKEMFRTQTPQRSELRSVGPNGLDSFHSGWFLPFPSSDGRKLGITLGTDLTEQRRIEKKMQSSDKLLRAIFEHAPVTLTVIDSDHHITYINRITAHREEDVLGAKPQDFIPKKDRDRVTEVFNQVFSTGKSGEYETSFLVPESNGTKVNRTYLTRVGRIRLEGTLAAVLIIFDVTAEREAQEALLKSEAQLRQAQKMEAVGQLTGGVAHDFNNLLTVILGAVDIASSRINDAEALECLEDAREAASKAGKLTERLLAFSRKQSLYPNAIDVHALFVDLEPLFKRTIREEIDLEMHTHGVIETCFVDVNQLENALLNLVLNARDAISGQGRIRVCADEIEVEQSSALQKDIPTGRYTRFLVADSGEGMTEEQKEHAFEPFYTTKEVGKGSGLGLSMVYGFVKQSGGHAYINDEPNGGVQIVLLLPCYAGI